MPTAYFRYIVAYVFTCGVYIGMGGRCCTASCCFASMIFVSRSWIWLSYYCWTVGSVDGAMLRLLFGSSYVF